MKTQMFGGIRVNSIAEFERHQGAGDLLAGVTTEDVAEHEHWLGPRLVEPGTRKLKHRSHAYLIRTPHHTILFDTCCGNDKEGSYYPRWHMLETPFLDKDETDRRRPDCLVRDDSPLRVGAQLRRPDGGPHSVGAGEASSSTAGFSLVADYFPKKRRGLALAIYMMGSNIGAAVSPNEADIASSWNRAFTGGPAPLGWPPGKRRSFASRCGAAPRMWLRQLCSQASGAISQSGIRR
ncbi:hypothetical protein AOQ72_16705 [Bradyrhizobium yuanmingense]|uniref:Uncharacterized protein n=1 Tax=Bradyrhizobium yuanmingense TaxID=108015 RepID=A0A0R3CUN2_9BRAD|nr:MFS transporter [Bradyrhizobium yuanmingense]KRP98747.1 hypothetical protein AOQ72_16705 [Bradyrhizobium yuanmingense]